MLVLAVEAAVARGEGHDALQLHAGGASRRHGSLFAKHGVLLRSVVESDAS